MMKVPMFLTAIADLLYNLSVYGLQFLLRRTGTSDLSVQDHYPGNVLHGIYYLDCIPDFPLHKLSLHEHNQERK